MIGEEADGGNQEEDANSGDNNAKGGEEAGGGSEEDHAKWGQEEGEGDKYHYLSFLTNLQVVGQSWSR